MTGPANKEKYETIFIGRGEELAQLTEFAARGRHVLVTGPEGVGKSALLERGHEMLSQIKNLYAFRIAESRQFKPALLELAEQMHERGIYQHPGLPSEALRGLPWRKLWPRVRALANKELAEAIALSFSGRQVVLIWDHVEHATPTQVAWFNHFLRVATLVVAAPNPQLPKLKTFLDRIPGRIKLVELTQAECFELIDRCLEVAPFAISDPKWYRLQIWRKSGGNPRAIKDLLGDHALEKYVDLGLIQSMHTEQGRKVIAMVPILILLVVAFSIYRYMGLGLGDREMYIVGGMGVVIFLALGALLRKGKKV